MMTCIALVRYCSRLFVVVFQDINCLHTFKHDDVHRVTEFFMFANAPVSVIRKLNQNKKEKNSDIGYFLFLGI